jgi:tRNA threonylcarbamoyladenosine biosynthesis protein TsaE
VKSQRHADHSTVQRTHSAAQTEALAAELAASLRGGECLALHGELGAGKTCFVRGLVRGLGAQPHSVASPTFVLLHIYDGGRLSVYHLDAYRARGPEDLESIGFGELLDQGGVVVVEWADRVAELIPPTALHVHIEALGPSERAITVRRPG